MVFVLAFGFAAIARQGGEIRVESELDSHTTMLGDSISLSIRVIGAHAKSIRAELPELDTLRFSSPRTITRQSSFNGRVEIATEFVYEIYGKVAGTHQIPAFPFEVEGKKYRFEGATVRFVEPELDERISVTMSVDKTSVYPDEPILITCVFSFGVSFERYGADMPFLKRADELNLTVDVPARNSASFNVSSISIPSEARSVTRNGVRVIERIVRIRAFPDQPGTLHLEGASVTADIVVGYKQTSDIFGRRQRELKRVYGRSEDITVEVKPLPSEGRPDDFYGLVGEYLISASTDLRSVKIGDPIELEISVAGGPRLDRVARPDLERLPGFENFKVDDDLSPGREEEGRMVFTRSLRAKNADVTEIPPIPLSYFDSETGRYVTVRSKPIPIEVESVERVTTDQIEGPGGVTVPVVEKTDRELRRGGIRANYVRPDALSHRGIEVDPMLPPLAAPILYVLLAGFVRFRRRAQSDVARQRARGARKRALGKLDEARSLVGRDDRAFFEALSLGLHRYCVDRFHLGEGEVTPADIDRLEAAGRLTADDASEARTLLETCDAARFGATALDASARESWLRRAQEWIERVERS